MAGSKKPKATAQSQTEDRKQSVAAQKRTYFVPSLRKSVKATDGQDLEEVVKAEKSKAKKNRGSK